MRTINLKRFLIEKMKKRLGIHSPSEIMYNQGTLFLNNYRHGLVCTEQEIKINNILKKPVVPEIEINKSQYETQIEIAKQYKGA